MDSEVQDLALIGGEGLVEDKGVVDTAVVSLVMLPNICEGEAGGVIEGCLGLDVASVGAGEVEAEVSSRVLGLHRAGDGEAVALMDPEVLHPVFHESRVERYSGLVQEVCEQRNILTFPGLSLQRLHQQHLLPPEQTTWTVVEDEGHFFRTPQSSRPASEPLQSE